VAVLPCDEVAPLFLVIKLPDGGVELFSGEAKLRFLKIEPPCGVFPPVPGHRFALTVKG
jgi:hypothetical protein